MDPFIWIGCILPLVSTAAIALLLMRSLRAGRCALAGLLAGMMLGPDVLGRAAPEFFERGWIGGMAERHELDAADRLHAAERMAAIAAGIPPDELDPVAARHAVQREELARTLRERQAAVRSVRHHLIGSMVFMLLVLSTAPGGRAPAETRLSVINIGLFSAAVPAGIAALILFAAGQPPAVFLACAAPLAAGGIPRSRTDDDIGNRAEQSGAALIRSAGRAATLLAIPLAGASAYLASDVSLSHLWPLLGAPAGALLALFRPARIASPAASAAAAALVPLLLGTIIATTLSVIAPRSHLHVGALIGLMLLTTDGRWIGALLGATIPGGRRTLPAMRLASGAMAAAPAQVAFAAVLWSTGLLLPAHALGLFAGGVLAELTAPLRRRAAGHLADAEEEIDHLHGPGDP